MEQTKFKTNITCSGCVATVRPYLNETAGEGNWQVDTKNPEKILTVTGDAPAEAIREALKQAGYRAEQLPAD
jgi:copper chaperone CopZ